MQCDVETAAADIATAAAAHAGTADGMLMAGLVVVDGDLEIAARRRDDGMRRR